MEDEWLCTASHCADLIALEDPNCEGFEWVRWILKSLVKSVVRLVPGWAEIPDDFHVPFLETGG